MAAPIILSVKQFLDADGHPYAGGTLASYIVGTSTAKPTYLDPDLTAQNPNPVVLDSAGRAVLYGDGDYRLVLEDAVGNQVWDQPSSTIVSAAMEPVISAPTVADARHMLGVDDAIAVEAAARAAADSAEATTRATGDLSLLNGLNTQVANLQSQIDAINAILAAPPAAGPLVQHGDAHADASGHTRITFATPYSALPDVVAQCVALSFDTNIASILVDNHGFDIWIAYSIPTVVPAPNIEFHWIAIGSP